MTKHAAAAAATFASLTNVALALKLMDNLVNRAKSLPGMAAFCGPSGYGKSTALSVVANKYRAIYVACRSYETKKSLLLSILHEMNIEPGRATIPELVEIIASELMRSEKPILLDETDHLVHRNLIELVRDLYEASGAPILMVGEERFPKHVKRWERFDNRILYWQMAEPCSLADARKLASLYAPKTAFADDWLQKCVDQVRGVTRRVCVNIENARREAEDGGAPPPKGGVTLAWWDKRAFYTGEAPARRVL